MESSIYLYSLKKGEISKFLSSFYSNPIHLENDLKWNIHFDNPIEMNDLIGVFIENIDQYKITMWICFDKGIFINITNDNADKIIRYIYERYPY